MFADRLGGNERVLALPEGFMKQVTTDLDNVWVPTSTGIDVALDNNYRCCQTGVQTHPDRQITMPFQLQPVGCNRTGWQEINEGVA